MILFKYLTASLWPIRARDSDIKYQNNRLKQLPTRDYFHRSYLVPGQTIFKYLLPWNRWYCSIVRLYFGTYWVSSLKILFTCLAHSRTPVCIDTPSLATHGQWTVNTKTVLTYLTLSLPQLWVWIFYNGYTVQGKGETAQSIADRVQWIIMNWGISQLLDCCFLLGFQSYRIENLFHRSYDIQR